jgi:hypothetical protein
MFYMLKMLMVDLSDAQLGTALLAFPFVALALVFALGLLVVRS